MTRSITKAFLLALLLVGCSGGHITLERGDVRIWVHDTGGLLSGGTDALVSGAISYDAANRCMYLGFGPNLQPVVWPAGTSITSGDPIILELPGGAEAREGDVVTGGGGYHQIQRFTELIPEECRSVGNEVAVFNAGENVEVNVDLED